MKKLNFRDVYKFPLEIDDRFTTKVFTEYNSMAFDFLSPMHKKRYPDMIQVSDRSRLQIVRCLNGEEEFDNTEFKFSYDVESSMIYLHIGRMKREFILVRGWGNLTGTGGHNLPIEEATRLQTEFAEYIIKTLTTMKPKEKEYAEPVVVPKVWEEIEVKGKKTHVLIPSTVSDYIRSLENKLK